MKVLIFSVDYSARSAALNVYNEAKQQGFDVEIAGTRTDPTEFVAKLRSSKPDIVFNFCIRPNLLPIYKLIKASGAKLCFWYPDMTESRRDRMWLTCMRDQADCLIFSIADTAIRYAQCAPVSLWMSQYFNVNCNFDNLPKRLDPSKPIYDLCFIGSVDVNRQHWLNELATKYITKFIINPFKIGGQVHNRQMVEIYAQSKIALGIQRTMFRTNAPYVVSNRIYNAMGSGAFYLSYPITQLNALFKNGEHLGVYDPETFEALKAMVDFWLAHELTREQIAFDGQQRILQRHTLQQRVSEYWQVFELLHTNNVDKIRSKASKIFPYLNASLYDLAIHINKDKNV